MQTSKAFECLLHFKPLVQKLRVFLLKYKKICLLCKNKYVYLL